jgi:hypothetical protein
MWQGNEDRRERGGAQEPRSSMGAPAKFLAQLRSAPYSSDVWKTVFVSSTSTDAPAPPGIERFPAAGETWVSPRLRELISNEPDLVDRLPGRVVGVIGASGLQSPDQIFSVAGVTPEANNGAIKAIGWGNTSPTNDRATLPRGPFLAILILLVGLPLIIFGRLVASLSAESRRRRTAALHLIGVPSRALVQAVTMESLLRGAIGASVGLVCFCLVIGPVARSTLLGFSWFPPASLVAGPSTVLTVALVALSVVLPARREVARELARPIQSRAGAPPSASLWRLMPCVVGVGLLLGIVGRQTITGAGGSSGGVLYFFYAGATLSVLGAATALPQLIRGGAMLVPHGVRRPWLHVARRRLESDPGPVARACAGFLVVCFAGLLGLAAIEDVRGLDSSSTIGRQLVITLPGADGVGEQHALLRVPAAAKVLELPENVGEATVATCADLVTVARQQSPSAAQAIQAGCRNGERYTFIDPTDGRPQPVRPGDQPVIIPTIVATPLRSGPVETRPVDSLATVARGANLLVYPGIARSIAS